MKIGRRFKIGDKVGTLTTDYNTNKDSVRYGTIIGKRIIFKGGLSEQPEFAVDLPDFGIVLRTAYDLWRVKEIKKTEEIIRER